MTKKITGMILVLLLVLGLGISAYAKGEIDEPLPERPIVLIDKVTP
ncbi:MAG: hypothetical protein FWC32_11055 [Firmicutes bacterium]|nr:hypothetical protein [Bacillota bacterium]